MTAESLDDLVRALCAHCARHVPRGQRLEGHAMFAEPEFQLLVAASRTAPPEERAAAAHSLAVTAATAPPYNAGRLAVVCGALVEGGSDPARSADPLVSRLRQLLADLAGQLDRTETRDDAAITRLLETNDTVDEQWTGLKVLAQGLVAHLVRLPALREALGQDAVVMTRLDALVDAGHAGAEWLQVVLQMQSGRLLVLHPQSSQAFDVTYRNIRSNFHLFTLLQGALAGEGKVPAPRLPDPAAVAAARGETDGSERVTDAALWDFLHWHGAAANAGFEGYIWGEGRPHDIPEIDGVRVVVLEPFSMGGRAWDDGFFSPVIRPAPGSLVVERVLPPLEAQPWFDRLRAARARARAT